MKPITATFAQSLYQLTHILIHRKPPQDESTSDKMDPNKTYVTALPGHSRPVFVRKRRSYRGNPFSLTAIAKALVPPARRRSYSVEHVVRMRSPSPTYIRAYPAPRPVVEYRNHSQPTVITQEIVHTYPRPSPFSQQVLDEQVLSDSIATRVTTHDARAGQTTLQHTCSSCGKYRSPRYHSRHVFVPDDIPRSGICRRCIRKHTSSEGSEDAVHQRRRRYSYEKNGRKFPHRKGRRRYATDSTETYLTSSSSKENTHVIQRTQSITGPNRRRTRSTSTDSTHIRITIQPDKIRKSRRIRSVEPVKLIEQTRCVQRSEGSSSISRGSGVLGFEQSVQVNIRSDRYGGTTMHTTAEPYRPRMLQTLEYGYDGDDAREPRNTSPAFGQRSASVLTEHKPFYHVERGGFIERRQQSYSPGRMADHGFGEEVYELDSYARVPQRRPTNSVRILRVSRDAEEPGEILGQHRVALARDASFIEGGPLMHHSRRRYFLAPKEPTTGYQRRETRSVEESSDEYSQRGT